MFTLQVRLIASKVNIDLKSTWIICIVLVKTGKAKFRRREVAGGGH